MRPGLRLNCGSVREALQNGAYLFINTDLYRFGIYVQHTWAHLEYWIIGVSACV